MTKPVYKLRQAKDGTFAWHASGPEDLEAKIHPTYLPDMQLLGWAPEDDVLGAARAWLAHRGIDAEVVLA